jgi:hypothetical protein
MPETGADTDCTDTNNLEWILDFNGDTMTYLLHTDSILLPSQRIFRSSLVVFSLEEKYEKYLF